MEGKTREAAGIRSILTSIDAEQQSCGNSSESPGRRGTNAAVEQGDYSVMERLLVVLSKPFAHSPEQKEYCTLPAPSSLPYRTFCGT